MQILQLLWVLVVVIPRPRAYLVQNPPSIPALLVVWLAARLRASKMIIDWHNFGYTVLGMSLGGAHPLVKVSTAYERFFAGRADGHLCVTQAMSQWLKEQWGVSATVLYDKAPPFFKETTLEQQHDLMLRLADVLPSELSIFNRRRAVLAERKQNEAEAAEEQDAASGSSTPSAGVRSRKAMAAANDREAVPMSIADKDERTLFTSKALDGTISLRPDRPALLVSSTSWTEDEDFDLLLKALIHLDAHACVMPASYPDFVVLVTGKGPMRDLYEARMGSLNLRRVHIRTLWLAPGDYPRLIGCADMGVCLHVSTSGLDLPMKVVDLFGCGTPVCAVNFSCLAELVHHDVNGMVFDKAPELGKQLVDLFKGFPGAPSATRIAKLRSGVKAGQGSRWHENWMANASRHFR